MVVPATKEMANLCDRRRLGAGTMCADDPCAVGVGACCIAGTCEAIDPDACAAAGGTFLGFGVICDTDPCALGAWRFETTSTSIQKLPMQ